MRTFFPTTANELAIFPNLHDIFREAAKAGHSSKQIFNLLSNLSNPYTSSALKIVHFLESILGNRQYLSFVKAKLNAPNSLQFSNDLSELFLLRFLLNNGYKVSAFETSKSQFKVPEFYAEKDTGGLLIELYSPIELYGYNEFFDDLRESLTYLNVDYDFDIKINIKIREKDRLDQTFYSYPYEIYSEYYKDDKTRISKIDEILKLFDSHVRKQEYKFDVQITKNVSLEFEIQLFKAKTHRLIVVNEPVNSVRSSVYFESAPCNAKGFYRKVFTKIRDNQLSQKGYPSATKVFFIDFTHIKDGYDLLKERDYIGKFYGSISRCLESEIRNSSIDLVFPIIAGIDSDFVLGKCIYNPKNLALPFN